MGKCKMIVKQFKKIIRELVGGKDLTTAWLRHVLSLLYLWDL
jgi:hypothetical protein